MRTILTVCLVGRPNVGKSTLFNKLTGSRRAIVDDFEGVTRDRMFGVADLDGVPAWLIDTGGFEPDAKDVIFTQVKEQAALAIEEADRICLVVDGRAGLTNIDEAMADMLRRSGKDVVLAVNKLDTPRAENEMAEFYALGFETVIPVSAEHSINLGDLEDALARGYQRPIPAEEAEDETEHIKEDPPRIAIVGVPNAGKSSIINRILGQTRMAVSDIPGTTRDSVDTVVKWHGRSFVFTDTAGIRRKSRISQKLEKYSVVMSLKALSGADVAVLVIDATRGVRDQDARIAGIIHDEARACIILVNKWDLVEKETGTAESFLQDLTEKLQFISHAPVLLVSAKTGQRVTRVFDEILRVSDEYRKRVDTGPLNRKVEVWTSRKLPPVYRGRRSRIFYVSQTRTAPPIFNFVVSKPEAIAEHYRRYLANRIRDEYGFTGSPIICKFSGRKQKRKK